MEMVMSRITANHSFTTMSKLAEKLLSSKDFRNPNALTASAVSEDTFLAWS